MSRWTLAAAVSALLVLAAVLAFLGVSVLAVGRETEADVEALRYAPASAQPERHDRTFPTRVGEALLGVSAERLYVDAGELAKAAGIPGEPEGIVVTHRAEAEALLGEIVRGDADPALRARAANLLGVLLFEDAKSARGNARRYLEQSLGGFQDAVRLDPSFDVARTNLEILARIPAGTSFGSIGAQGQSASSSGGGESGY